MTIVTVSPRLQVSIPEEACEILNIHPGQELEIVVHEGHIQLAPIPPIESLRGVLKGCPEAFVREKADRPL